MIGRLSGVLLQIDGYVDARGAERATLRLCVDTFGCYTIESRPSGEVPGEVDCEVLASADGHETRCRIDDGGELGLFIMPESSRPEPAERDYDLVFQQGRVEVHAPGTVSIESLYEDGVDCGITSVRGTLTLDPTTFAPVR